MLIQRSQPLAPVLPRLPRPIAGACRALLRHALGDLRGGRLEVELPGGERWQLGDGSGPLATATVHDDRLFARALVRGELGLGESYVAGEWDAPDLVGVLRLFVRNLARLGLESRLTRLGRLPDRLRHRLRGRRLASERNIHAHYDLGNDFYRGFLDDRMVYSCAIFDPGDSLEQAQVRKLDRICRTLELGPGDHLLEIGCGWGALAIHAAKTTGCRITAITLSREQLGFARQRVEAEGLGDRVEIRYADFRDLRGQFDKVASIEMIESVGYRGLFELFGAIDRLLVPGGAALIQSITMPDERFEAYRRDVDWMQTYVFPGALIPSMGALRTAMVGTRLRVEESFEIGPHYAPTLAEWRRRFADRGAQRFADRFRRTWELYLAFSEASFAERTLGDVQLLVRREG